jgi:hypothetical protein
MSEAEEETITVGTVSDGPGGEGTPGEPLSLPVVEVLTGRAFLTGKSGSGKSNTASVVIENLLDEGFPVLVVDTDGEYYGLKEEYEVLHAGADEECDIQVSPEHAGKIADLALEQNVPIILDVSGYLDEDVAKDLLRETTRHLFAKEKKLKKPFLMLIEECHEYIPEGGGLDETGKMLVKVGKRGRKHGLGILGISQRPADVKKDFITQCDWLVWHRLTWGNDTKVVGRILGREYADAIEDMDDGEAFVMTDWSEDVRRVQFHRKQTFDAGATPGLGDFERPELKSVDSDLVSELRDISEERERRESELADLRQELDRKEAKIRELEAELAEARDLKAMADRFSQALLGRAEAPYRSAGDGESSPSPADAAADGPADAATADPTDAATDGPADATPAEDPAMVHAPATGTAEGAAATGSADPADRQTAGVGAGDGDATGGDADRNGAAGDGEWAFASSPLGTREAVVAELTRRVEAQSDLALGMLAHYREVGVADPVDAHVAAGGDGDRTLALARNRALRRAGLVSHAGRGRYEYAVPALVSAAYDGRLDRLDRRSIVREVESLFGADAD